MNDAPAKLRRFIVEHYSLDEFRTLCFDLGVRYDSLGGDTIDAKSRELLHHMRRQGRLAELLAVLEETRTASYARADFPKDSVSLEEAFSQSASVPPGPPGSLEPAPSPGRARWQLTFRVIAVLTWVLAVIWLLVEPGFEPLLAFLAGVVPLLTSFFMGEGSERGAVQWEKIKVRNQRIRAALLERVRIVWIRGILENSLSEAVRIELGLAARPGAVKRPWVMQLEHADQPDRLLPGGTKVIDVFHELGGALLILGEPGSGKTFTLLELAHDLLEVAEKETYRPVPLVFNLSSWAGERLPLVEWLAQELNLIYEVSKRYSQEWLGQMAFHLLLDGLDEVKEEHREACVEAINHFRHENGFVNIVVCSRTADYEQLSEKLQLMGAVVIQPLTQTLIDEYLSSGDEQLALARDAVRNDPLLQDLAQTPLILNIIALAYHEKALDDLATGTVDERHQYLFRAYVQRMFKRRGAAEEQDKAQSIRYLTWLAARMREQAKSVLYIERLQPDWLGSKETLYRIAAGLVLGLVVGLVFGLGGGLAFGLIYGLIVGLVGVLIGVVVGGFGEIDLVEVLDFSLKRGIERLFEERTWLIGGLLYILILALVFGPDIGLGIGLVLFVLSVTLGAFQRREIQSRISPNQGIRLSIRNALIGALSFGLVFGLVLGLALGLVGELAFGLVFGFLLGLVFGFLFYGGGTAIRHAVLRLFLARYRFLPLRLIDFLDDMSDRIILRKVGGGYMFIHRMLLEYFASLKKEGRADDRTT